MTCEITYDEAGFPIEFRCGVKQPTDHECDLHGGYVDLDTGMGIVNTATCSICGKPAFSFRDIW